MVRVNESNLPVNAETDAGYGQLLSILIRRRFWLLGVLGGVLTVATIFTLMSKPTYQSSMQMLIEPNYQGKKETEADLRTEQFAGSTIRIDSTLR